MNFKKSTKIYIAGHRGMVGSAVWRALESKGYSNLLGKTSAELDLRNQQAVTDFYKKEQPGIVINAAAKAGFDAITGTITSTVKSICFYSLLTVASNISVRYNKITTSWPFDMLNPDNCTGAASPSFNWPAALRKAAWCLCSIIASPPGASIKNSAASVGSRSNRSRPSKNTRDGS